MLCSEKLNALLIEKSAQWQRISQRLRGIQGIRNFLDSDFKIYRFSAKRLPFFSKISASYLLHHEQTKESFFLFLDADKHCYYCKSIFADDAQNYTLNQTPWVVLRKAVIENGVETVLYHNHAYTEENSQSISE